MGKRFDFSDRYDLWQGAQISRDACSDRIGRMGSRGLVSLETLPLPLTDPVGRLTKIPRTRRQGLGSLGEEIGGDRVEGVEGVRTRRVCRKYHGG